jgi:hypothetical protein
MSFQDRLRREGYSSRGLQGARSDEGVIKSENDFPFDHVDFIRVGSAHAVERYDRHDMIRATESIAHEIEARYEPDHPPSPVIVDLK